MPLKHVCAQVTHCKEVVIPDSGGNPIGGLTCAGFCKGKAPPGYKPWQKPPGPAFEAVLPVTLVFVDSESGEVIELSRGDVEVIALAASKEGWL